MRDGSAVSSMYDICSKAAPEGWEIRSGSMLNLSVQRLAPQSGSSVSSARVMKLALWEDEAIGRIANALNFRLTRLESERGLRERGGNPEAFDLTTRGWALVHAAKNPGQLPLCARPF